MGKISAQLVENSIIITKFNSNGFIVPYGISQERNIVSVISSNVDMDTSEDDSREKDSVVRAVSRGEFIFKLLSLLEKQGSDLESKYSFFCKGLYSESDLKKGITWSEAAYLLYYVGELGRCLDWKSIKPKEGYRICVLQEVVHGRKVINEKLAMYKNRLDMEYYIRSIVKGDRFIPLPLYCAYYDLISSGSLDGIAELNLSMMFRKVSEDEFNRLLD